MSRLTVLHLVQTKSESTDSSFFTDRPVDQNAVWLQALFFIEWKKPPHSLAMLMPLLSLSAAHSVNETVSQTLTGDTNCRTRTMCGHLGKPPTELQADEAG